MRRSIAAGFGIAAVLGFAACTDRADQQSPLAPTEPTFAVGDICSGSLASQIAKEQKALFTGALLTEFQDDFKDIKSLCSSMPMSLMLDYIQKVIDNRGTVDDVRGPLLVNHWKSLALYVTGDSDEISRPYTVLTDSGGAAVLEAGQSMTTFDEGAQLIAGGSPGDSSHLYTFEPKPSSFCDGTTTLRVTGPGNARIRGAGADCYDLRDYPHETTPYDPPAKLTLCMLEEFGPTGIVHEDSEFGGEVLPPVITDYDCTAFHPPTTTGWLGREAGPLGRLLARAYDYLRPQSLFADDVGESGGLMDSFSLVGGVLSTVFADSLETQGPGAFPDGTDPVVGDFASSWLVQVNHPGYIQIQNGFSNMTGNVVVISQALGNCSQCPPVSLLGTRVNPSATDTIGAYEITWRSRQEKPSVKEAPFVVRSYNGVEIARLSYVTESSQNRLRYNGAIVTDGSGSPITWSTGQAHDFKITVNLLTLNGENSYRTSLAINGTTHVSNTPFVSTVSGVPVAVAEKTVSTIGYHLTGIDAGIVVADNFLMKRLQDSP
jgi:hypothetical protein